MAASKKKGIGTAARAKKSARAGSDRADVELLVSGVEFTAREVSEIEQFVSEIISRKTGRSGAAALGISTVACVL